MPSTEFSLTKPRAIARNMKNGIRRARHIVVDVENRMKRSFGNPVAQKVEIHYQGKPFTFNYTSQMETISIDLVHREQQMASGTHATPSDPAVEVEQFDPAKRRMDTSIAYFACSCNIMIKGSIATPLAEARNQELIIRGIQEPSVKSLVLDHMAKGHTIHLTHTDSQVEVIPPERQIKNFSQDRINFYRLFPDSTVEVKYLCSYGQDLLSEAPQYKFSETSNGKDYLGKQNFYFTIFIVGMLMLIEYAAVSSMISSYYSFAVTTTNATNSDAWYLLIAVMLIMGGALWRVHIHDVSNQWVKYITLQSAPFYISNRGILPVVMTNSALNPVWDYQSRMMELNADAALDVFHTLTTWSDEQIVQLHRANILGTVEHELSVVKNELTDLKNKDYEYRTKTTKQNASWKQILAVATISVVGTFSIMFFLFG